MSKMSILASKTFGPEIGIYKFNTELVYVHQGLTKLTKRNDDISSRIHPLKWLWHFVNVSNGTACP